jgi:hypothetical protein
MPVEQGEIWLKASEHRHLGHCHRELRATSQDRLKNRYFNVTVLRHWHFVSPDAASTRSPSRRRARGHFPPNRRMVTESRQWIDATLQTCVRSMRREFTSHSVCYANASWGGDPASCRSHVQTVTCYIFLKARVRWHQPNYSVNAAAQIPFISS